MNCELVKQKVSFKGKDGKDRTSFNYYLVFDNGIRVPIVCKYYPVDVDDKKIAQFRHDVNARNATRLDTMATLEEGK